MKLFFIIVLIALAVFAVHYFQSVYPTQPKQCPAGSRYERRAAGGGWADTDPSDPFGTCVPESEINSVVNP